MLFVPTPPPQGVVCPRARRPFCGAGRRDRAHRRRLRRNRTAPFQEKKQPAKKLKLKSIQPYDAAGLTANPSPNMSFSIKYKVPQNHKAFMRFSRFLFECPRLFLWVRVSFTGKKDSGHESGAISRFHWRASMKDIQADGGTGEVIFFPQPNFCSHPYHECDIFYKKKICFRGLSIWTSFFEGIEIRRTDLLFPLYQTAAIPRILHMHLFLQTLGLFGSNCCRIKQDEHSFIFS